MSDTRDEGKIRLVRHCDAFWRVTFDLPPLNIFGPANIQQLEENKATACHFGRRQP